MEINVSKVHYDEDNKRIRVHVYYSEQLGNVFESAEVTVFIDAVDSYAEMKRLGLERAKAFLSRAETAA